MLKYLQKAEIKIQWDPLVHLWQEIGCEIQSLKRQKDYIFTGTQQSNSHQINDVAHSGKKTRKKRWKQVWLEPQNLTSQPLLKINKKVITRVSQMITLVSLLLTLSGYCPTGANRDGEAREAVHKQKYQNYNKAINDSNEIRTHNHLVRKQTLIHLAKCSSTN